VRTSRAVVLEKPGTLTMHELAVPSPAAGAIVARVTMGGVCGSDVHMTRGEFPLPFPIVLGHEGVGVIEELGAGVSHDHAGVAVEVGDPVYWNPIAPCHHCWYCTVEKDFSSCTNSTWFGPIDQPTRGSYADYITLPPSAAFYRIPDGTPPEAVIAFGCALPAVLQAFERLGGVTPMTDVVVQGAGPIGLAAVLLAHLSGARTVIAIDGSRLRLDLAKQFGATHTLSLVDTTPEERRERVASLTDGRGAETVVEGTGHRSAFKEGIRLCSRNGRYLLIGLWASQGEIEFDPSYVVQNNLRIIGSQYAQARHYHGAVSLVARHHQAFPFTGVVTHRCGLEAAQSALDLVVSGSAAKVVMVPQAEPGE
jgi:threonine dehydrogenase-like Zn-dependent dehydrogenase